MNAIASPTCCIRSLIVLSQISVCREPLFVSLCDCSCNGVVNHCIIYETARGFGFVESYIVYESLKSLVLHYAQNSLEEYNDSLSTTLAFPVFGTAPNQPVLPSKEKVREKARYEKDKQERLQDLVTQQEHNHQDSDRESRQQENQTQASVVGGYVLAHPR